MWIRKRDDLWSVNWFAWFVKVRIGERNNTKYNKATIAAASVVVIGRTTN